jgi:hypothetical protein
VLVAGEMRAAARQHQHVAPLERAPARLQARLAACSARAICRPSTNWRWRASRARGSSSQSRAAARRPRLRPRLDAPVGGRVPRVAAPAVGASRRRPTRDAASASSSSPSPSASGSRQTKPSLVAPGRVAAGSRPSRRGRTVGRLAQARVDPVEHRRGDPPGRVGGEVDRVEATHQQLSRGLEHAAVGPAEAIDRLLDVAHDEDARPLRGRRRSSRAIGHDLPLQRVGVLEPRRRAAGGMRAVQRTARTRRTTRRAP